MTSDLADRYGGGEYEIWSVKPNKSQYVMDIEGEEMDWDQLIAAQNMSDQSSQPDESTGIAQKSGSPGKRISESIAEAYADRLIADPEAMGRLGPAIMAKSLNLDVSVLTGVAPPSSAEDAALERWMADNLELVRNPSSASTGSN